MNLVGKELGNRYEILEKIGEGGMATVYKAKCRLLNRYVAVKVLKDEYSKDTLFVKRFKIEAQSAASLTHPNIVSVYDVGEEENINYIVMELLEGDTLKDYIEKKGKLDVDETINLSIQIASALEAAHKSKIIHRDIKPQNIVLTRNMTQAKVTDFGIAKMSSTATITTLGSSTIGSVHYFSPEHAKGGYTDEKSDIYSLGIVMYEMATGELPFNADSPVSVALKQIQEEPKAPKEINPDISDALNEIILKAMAKSTSDRYQTATDLVEDLTSARYNPNQKFLKSNSDVMASATQVIPIIGMKDLDEKSSSISAGTSRKSSRRGNSSNALHEPNKEKKEHDDIKDSEDILNIPEKKKKPLLIVLISVAVVCVGILVGLAVNLILKFNQDEEPGITVAPELLGEIYEEIKGEYKEKGLNISLDKYEFSSEYTEGQIMEQSIEAGKTLPSNKISVVVSKGAKEVKMINTVGKEYTVIKYELEALELKPQFEFEINEKVQENIIISQDKKEGTILKAGDTVKIVVSKGNGKTKVIVPNVLTMSEKEATTTLQELKLKVNITYSEDTTKTNGIILSQSYKQNSEVYEGTLIELTVNRIQKSKVITIPVESYIEEGSTEPVTLKIVAKVEGVSNTIYERSVSAPYSSVDVSVNGYTTATLYVYINETLKDTQNITF